MDTNIALAIGTLIGCFFALSWFAGTDAPYVPSRMDKVKKALKLVGLKKTDTFYELGSGDGRVVIEAAKTALKAVGIEQSWLRVFYSRYKAKKLNLPNAHFQHGDIFKKDLSSASVVFIYLLPVGVKKLESKLQNELQKGSRVVTQTYHFPTWKPLKKDGDFWVYIK